LYTAYSAITSGVGADARDKLFAANAERIYRC
jgi:L-fuconolactonase